MAKTSLASDAHTQGTPLPERCGRSNGLQLCQSRSWPWTLLILTSQPGPRPASSLWVCPATTLLSDLLTITEPDPHLQMDVPV